MRQREAQLQKACVAWFRLAHSRHARLLFAVPNGGTRNIREAVNLKEQGVTPGVADLILLIPNRDHGALCIELKVAKNVQTNYQKEFQEAAEAAGNKYVVCRDWPEFRDQVEAYLKNR